MSLTEQETFYTKFYSPYASQLQIKEDNINEFFTKFDNHILVGTPQPISTFLNVLALKTLWHKKFFSSHFQPVCLPLLSVPEINLI